MHILPICEITTQLTVSAPLLRGCPIRIARAARLTPMLPPMLLRRLAACQVGGYCIVRK